MHVDSDTEKNKRASVRLKEDAARVPAALTDVGLERAVNEDRCALISMPGAACYLVLDGMGGVEGGEFAAQLGADAVRQALQGEYREPLDAIRHAFEVANTAVVLRRQSNKFNEMGTTIVGALIEGSSVAIAHVGDSRAYLVRGDSIDQLTTDHSFVQELVERKEISKEEALPHPQSHILTQCLGSSSHVRVDAKQFWIWPPESGEVGDYLVLCTDGLYSMVSEESIAAVVVSSPPLEACHELVRLANESGGFDNITVAIIPLPGRLKDEVSPTRGKEVKARERNKKKEQWWKRSIMFHFFLAAVAGFGAAALAVGAFFLLRILQGF